MRKFKYVGHSERSAGMFTYNDGAFTIGKTYSLDNGGEIDFTDNTVHIRDDEDVLMWEVLDLFQEVE